MVEDREVYIEAGMGDHAAKPVEAREIARTIDRVPARQCQIQH